MRCRSPATLPPAFYSLDSTSGQRESASTARAAGSIAAPTLIVYPPQAAAGFDSQRITYVREAHRLDYFAHSEWVDTPARMLAPLIVAAIESSGTSHSVLQAPTAAVGEQRLNTEIPRLQQEFSSQPSRVRFTTPRYAACSRSSAASQAHAVGVLGPKGRGLAALLGLEDRIELHMGTLSKALGLSGGYLAASRQMIDVLINRARSFIYSTAPPPHLAHAAAEMLNLVSGEEGESRRQRLREHVQSLRRHLGAPEHPAAILPVILGGESDAMQASKSLLEAGFLVPAIRYPTVARGQARLRFTLSAGHTEEQIEQLAGVWGPIAPKKS